MTKLSDFPTQHPKGWVPEGEGVLSLLSLLFLLFRLFLLRGLKGEAVRTRNPSTGTHAAAAQHKQLRARWTGGALPTSSSSTRAPAAASAARASTAAATTAAAAAATAAASCTTTGGKGRLAVRAA